MPFTFMARPNGPRVRELRMKREWTQAELGRKAQMSAMSISTIENSRAVSKHLMRRVASALKVSYDEITFPRSDDEQAEAEIAA